MIDGHTYTVPLGVANILIRMAYYIHAYMTNEDYF
jgi:hypothetical protein